MSKDALVSHLSHSIYGRCKPVVVKTTRLPGRAALLGGKRKARSGSGGTTQAGPAPHLGLHA
jgi:hypothetical protein